MKFSSITCALALFAVFNIANAKSMCTPMAKGMKEMYEKAYGTEFMGCSVTPGEAMTAMGRLNWVTPENGHPLVEMVSDAEMGDMDKMKGGSMMMGGMKVAAASVGGTGYLTVSLECYNSLTPDFIYSALAKSSSPKVFNALLEAACEGGDSVRTLKKTVRASEATTATAEALICIIGALLGAFFPGLITDALVDTLKEIVENVFMILPCPSDVMRIVEPIVRA